MARRVVLGMGLSALVAACSFQSGQAGDLLDAATGGGSGVGSGSGSGVGTGSGSGSGSGAGSGSGSGSSVDASQAGEWTCGATPAAPSSTVTIQNTTQDLKLDAIDLTGGEEGSFTSGQLVVAKAGASMTLALSFTIKDTTCPSECIDQIEVGWVQGSSGPRDGCVWSNGVPEPDGTSGNVSGFAIKAPTTAGEYDLRTDIGQGYSCGSQTTWWDPPAPPSGQTLVKLCVQ